MFFQISHNKTFNSFFSIREIPENLFERFTTVYLQKFSPLTHKFNLLLSRQRAGGLIDHYWNDPLYLEQTMPMQLFTFYDSSKDKLTVKTFFLIFVLWLIGAFLSLMCLLAENLYCNRRRA